MQVIKVVFYRLLSIRIFSNCREIFIHKRNHNLFPVSFSIRFTFHFLFTQSLNGDFSYAVRCRRESTFDTSDFAREQTTGRSWSTRLGNELFGKRR